MTNTDFGCQKNVQRTKKADSFAYWNKRAETFGAQCGGRSQKNRYAQRFLQLLDIPKGASVLDMGCATGTLAIPLAEEKHPVIACDFSPKMIEKLQGVVSAENLPITCKLMAWEDDWTAYGLEPNSVNVAIASRSLGFDDHKNALKKLDGVALDVAAITISASPVPAYEPRLIQHLGRPTPPNNELPSIISILLEMGRFPIVDYIPCERPMCFDNLDTARDELRRMAGLEPFTPREQTSFDEYVRAHFKEKHTEGGTVFQLDYTLVVPWAFVKWSTKNDPTRHDL